MLTWHVPLSDETMTHSTASAAVPEEYRENPSFATERLSLDVAAVTDVIHRTLRGISTTETPDGVKFRTSDGMLIAYLSGTDDEASPVELHYRTAPASDTATLKARRLRRALEQYAV